MTNRPSDFYAALAQIVGVCSLAGDASFAGYLSKIPDVGNYVVGILAIMGTVGLVAAKLLTLQSNPSPPPGQASVVTPVPKGVATVTIAPNLVPGTPNK